MLSKKTKYALHALTYLGKHKDEKTVLIQDIAEEHGISHKFLENIQLEPDITIYNDPSVLEAGEDQQLIKAIETLMYEIE